MTEYLLILIFTSERVKPPSNGCLEEKNIIRLNRIDNP